MAGSTRRAWWSRREVERYLEVSRARVRQLAADGRLKVRRGAAGAFEYHRDSVLAYERHRDGMPGSGRRGFEFADVPVSPAVSGDRATPGVAADPQARRGRLFDAFDVMRLQSAVDGRWDGQHPEGLVQAINQVRDTERWVGEAQAAVHYQHALGSLERENTRLRRERDNWRRRAQLDARERRQRARSVAVLAQRTAGAREPLAEYMLQRLWKRFPDFSLSDQQIEEALSEELAALLR
ncbi:MAG: hypothetical protein SF187_01880 [Deltaproteobacteria bacterium]|nr:hypothetical protein [Deltaproteobacteria bacterium]